VSSATSPGYGNGRDALLASVVRVAAKLGIQRVTNRAVASEAGVTHGLVTHHFGSRTNLLHEALVRAARESIDVSTLEPPSGHLENFAETLGQLVADDPDMQAFQFEFVLEARRQQMLAPEARMLYDTYINATDAALHRFGIDTTPALTRVVFAALDGLVIQQLIYQDPARTQQAVGALRALLESLPKRAGHEGARTETAARPSV
jgi:AcrR family transcriptional regulator